ncbi:MAG: iron-containing alcohol dehydrogenase [Bacteroidota bacterium]|nr:iron-containing alcohol dehydrogenase [Bacteroidota bacterium]
MVKPFLFARTPKIIFGNGKIAELAGIAKSYGNDILLVTGADSFIHSKHGEYLLNTFDMTGIHYHIVNINREPSPEMVDLAVIRHQNDNIRLVIAIGGGSVIDAGKAISAMLNRSESVIEFLEGVGTKEHPGTKLPFIAVPTTSGTGSETTKNAVISQVGVGGFKKSLRHDNFVPDIAIIDPELTLHCPPPITAASGMDCFTQLVEAYLSNKPVPFTDALAYDGIAQLRIALPRVWKWGEDLEARSGMSYAALVSGISLANAGLGIVHGFASSIGGMFNIPHGIVCGTLMAPANAITIKRLMELNESSPALIKYAELGQLFSGEEQRSQDFYLSYFIDILISWTDMMNIDRLSKYGVKSSDFENIIQLTEQKNHPLKLSKEDLTKILESRL